MHYRAQNIFGKQWLFAKYLFMINIDNPTAAKIKSRQERLMFRRLYQIISI